MTLESVSEFFVLSGFLCAITIFFDITNNRAQQNNLIVFIWITTGFWGSWIALYSYFKIGRSEKQYQETDEEKTSLPHLKSIFIRPKKRTFSEKTFLSTLYCGSVFILSLALTQFISSFLSCLLSDDFIDYAQWAITYMLALIIAITFRYDYVASRQEIARDSLKKAISKTFKSDLISLTAWQIAFNGYLLFISSKTQRLTDDNLWNFWFIIQIAMFCGFILTLLTNGIMLKFGLKKTI